MESLVTMTEIARIAGVTRQAVTNWRRRPASAPFPSAVEAAQGIERFDLSKVLDWLDETGRGRNDEARLDAPSVAVPDDLDLTDAVVMLSLRGSVSQDLANLTPDERVALAEELDPDDRYLLTEIQSLADDDALAAYVDELLAASFGSADALARLYASRAAQGNRGLAPEMIELLRELAGACRTHLGPDGVAVELQLDPRDHQIGEGFGATSGTVERSTLRHHALTGMAPEGAKGPLVRVVSTVGLDDAQTLEVAGDLAIGLDADEVAIVLGPASALCDRLSGEPYTARKSALKMGTESYGCALAAALKLPRGLWRGAYRQCLGVWVLQGETTATGAVVADLSGTQIDRTELAADVLGALERTGARSYLYGRIVPYNDVWTRDAVVVPGVGARSVPSAGLTSRAYDRLVEATLVTQEGVAGFDLAPVERGTSTVTRTRSLGELVDTGDVTLHSGSRIAAEDLDPAGSLRVISAGTSEDELRIDPLVAADRYSHATRTERGDVVFAHIPQPHAVVDGDGGSLVQSPSRILRVRERAGTGPRALAAAINELATSAEWKTWSVPDVPRAQIQPLEDALGGVLDHVAELRRHEQASTSIITNLIQGVADGSVTLASPTTERKAG